MDDGPGPGPPQGKAIILLIHADQDLSTVRKKSGEGGCEVGTQGEHSLPGKTPQQGAKSWPPVQNAATARFADQKGDAGVAVMGPLAQRSTKMNYQLPLSGTEKCPVIVPSRRGKKTSFTIYIVDVQELAAFLPADSVLKTNNLYAAQRFADGFLTAGGQ